MRHGKKFRSLVKIEKKLWIFPFSGEFSPCAQTPGHSWVVGQRLTEKQTRIFPIFSPFFQGNTAQLSCASGPSAPLERWFFGKRAQIQRLPESLCSQRCSQAHLLHLLNYPRVSLMRWPSGMGYLGEIFIFIYLYRHLLYLY